VRPAGPVEAGERGGSDEAADEEEDEAGFEASVERAIGAADRDHFGIAKVADEPLQPVAGDAAVRIRRRDEVGAGDRGPIVPSPPDAGARLLDHAVRMSCGDLSRAVGTSSVDHDDLELAPREGLLVELPQERLDPSGLVVRRHDDRDLQATASRASARERPRRITWSVLM